VVLPADAPAEIYQAVVGTPIVIDDNPLNGESELDGRRARRQRHVRRMDADGSGRTDAQPENDHTAAGTMCW